MDMPIFIGSLSIIKSIKLPTNSIVFYYKIGSKGCFEKSPEKTIEIIGEGTHQKPPKRFHDIDDKMLEYHCFKLSQIESVLFDGDFSMPIAYGSNQRIQATINKIPKNSVIYYYKEDVSVKNSFKFFMIFEGKK